MLTIRRPHVWLPLLLLFAVVPGIAAETTKAASRAPAARSKKTARTTKIHLAAQADSKARAPSPNDKIAAELEAHGAIITRDAEDPQQPIVAVDWHQSHIVDANLALLHGLDTLKRLDLSECYITVGDEALAHLGTLTSLEELTFHGSTPGSDGWLAPLRKLTKLKSLDLDIPLHFSPVIHDAGIENLSQLIRLEKLVVRGEGITDKSMQSLAQAVNLRELDLHQTGITGQGFETLRRFPHLRRLWISSEQINNDTMAVLEDLRELEFATLAGNQLTGDVLKHLRAPQLRELRLDGHLIGDEACKNMQALRNLETLYLYRLQVSDQGLPALSKVSKLKTLIVDSCRIRGSGLATLKLKQLEHLQLSEPELPFQVPGEGLDGQSLQHLKNFPKLETLGLQRAQIGNAGLAHLKFAPRLKKLDLLSVGATEEGLIHLKSLKQLEWLNLLGNYAVGPGLEHLRSMTKLQHFFPPASVNDAQLGQIAELKALRELDLTAAKLTDAGMPSLAKLTKLKKLRMPRSPGVTERGIEQLAALTQLQTLALPDNQVTDTTLAKLLKLEQLEDLYLQSNRLTDAGFDQLQGFPKLQTLWTGGVSEAAIHRLQEHNRRVKIYNSSDQPVSR